MYMVKMVSLSEEAYSILRRMKNEGMSYSDIIVENLGHIDKEKTDTLKDLVNWVKSFSSRKKKEKISTKIDELVYGINR